MIGYSANHLEGGMGRKKLKIGIIGASGRVGKSLLERLLDTKNLNTGIGDITDPVERIYLEIKDSNGALEDEFNPRAKQRGMEMEYVHVSSDGYDRFRECDMIFVCAGRETPKNIMRSLDAGQMPSYETFRGEAMGGFEARVAGALNGAANEDEITEAYDVLNIMSAFKKKGMVGYRALQFFPLSVPIIKKYAKILGDDKDEGGIGYKGLTVIVTNVPDYNCDVFAAVSPELAEMTMGLTGYEQMRLVCDILQREDITAGQAEYPPRGSMIVPSLCAHDDPWMIIAPELSLYKSGKMALRPEELSELAGYVSRFQKAIMENKTKVRDALVRYAKEHKEFRDIKVDAVQSAMELIAAVNNSNLEGMSEEQKKYRDDRVPLANSIIRRIRKDDPNDRRIIYATQPHNMDGTTIEPCGYEERMGQETKDAMKRYEDFSLEMLTKFSERGIIPRMPMLPEKMPEHKGFVDRAMPDVTIAALREGCGLENIVGIYHPQNPETAAQIRIRSDASETEAKDEMMIEGIRMAQEGIIFTLQKSHYNRIAGRRVYSSKILRYSAGEDDSAVESARIEGIEGQITEKAMSIDDDFYAGSMEDDHVGIRAFRDGKECESYKTREKTKICCIGHGDIKGRTYLAGGSKRGVHVWKAGSAGEKEKFVLKGNKTEIMGLDIAKNLCVAREINENIHVWNMDDSHGRDKPSSTIRSHNGLYGIGVCGEAIRIATVYHDEKNGKYWVKVFSVDEGGRIADEPSWKQHVLEEPTYIGLFNDHVIVKKNNGLWCSAMKGSVSGSFVQIGLEHADLSRMCIEGCRHGI